MKLKLQRVNLIIWSLIILLMVPLTSWCNDEVKELSIQRILKMSINASINPATFQYLSNGFKKAHKKSYSMILIQMNTPGGLVTTTKEIITLIGESQIPVVIWVSPEGASATSAGAIISASAHLLYMSSGTNIGAATPVSISPSFSPQDKLKKGEKKEKAIIDSNDGSLKKKALNDLMALVRSLSEARERNGEMFADMISKASSFEAKKAFKKNIINGLASNLNDIINDLNQKTITIQGKKVKLAVDNRPMVDNHEMSLGEIILNVFADPSLAYILFIIGAALIYLEFQTGGGVVAGALGALALILAGISFQVLPLNFGALGLIILSFILFIIEIYVVSYGILTISGLLSLTFGSLFLFQSENSYIEMPIMVIASTILSISLFLVMIGLFWFFDSKKHKKTKRTSADHMGIINSTGLVVAKIGQNKLQVKINGEIWRGTPSQEESFKIGEEVKIVNISESGMELILASPENSNE